MITIASVVTLSMYLLTGPGTFHCVYVKHYTHCNIISLLVKLYFPTLDLNTLLSSLPGHSVTHRFNIHLSFVIKKKSICKVVGRLPQLLIKQSCFLAHYKQLKCLQCCTHGCAVYMRNYLHIIHIDCLLKDCDIADLS